MKFEGRKGAPMLDEQTLLETDNPARVLRDTTISLRPASDLLDSGSTLVQYIELANGDRLIGRVQTVMLGAAAQLWPDHSVIDNTIHSGRIRVRVDWICSIHNAGDEVPANAPDTTTGYVRLRDGRKSTLKLLGKSSSGAWIYPGFLRK